MVPTTSSCDREDGTVFVFDLARALAAFAVLVAHARGIILADLPLQPPLPAAGRLVFGFTALGHQAVIVFLVLSGTLVTGSALAALDAGRWSAADFARARLTRLWIVLLPCLVFGGAEDRIGLALAHAHGLGRYGADGANTVAGRLDLPTFVGNVLFLQGFGVPTFGSNVPLWTLAVEAWCYAGLLALMGLWSGRRQPGTAGAILATAAVAAYVLPPAFWAISPIWGVGALFALWLRWSGARTIGGGPGVPRRWQWSVAGLAAMVAVTGARALAARNLAASDYLLAGGTVAILAALQDWRPAATRLCRVVRFAAGFSYTLYLAHFPVLALLAVVVLGSRRLAWSGAGAALWFAAVAVAVLQALVLWWLFERHTGTVRAVVDARWGIATPRVGVP